LRQMKALKVIYDNQSAVLSSQSSLDKSVMLCGDQGSKFLNINNPFSGQVMQEMSKNTNQIEQIARETQQALSKVQSIILEHIKIFRDENKKVKEYYKSRVSDVFA
jgi:predicted nucleic acid-binding protein